MKHLITILIAVSFTAVLWAQPPDQISYQAVVRNSEGNLLINQQVGILISILQGSENGTAIYTETQTPVTNANGLVDMVESGEEVSQNPQKQFAACHTLTSHNVRDMSDKIGRTSSGESPPIEIIWSFSNKLNT